MIFDNDLGKLFAPNPDRCAVARITSSGLVEDGGVVEEE
jgi:hypothetical protein